MIMGQEDTCGTQGDLKILVIKIFNPSILLFCKNGASIISTTDVII